MRLLSRSDGRDGPGPGRVSAIAGHPFGHPEPIPGGHHRPLRPGRPPTVSPSPRPRRSAGGRRPWSPTGSGSSGVKGRPGSWTSSSVQVLARSATRSMPNSSSVALRRPEGEDTVEILETGPLPATSRSARENARTAKNGAPRASRFDRPGDEGDAQGPTPADEQKQIQNRWVRCRLMRPTGSLVSPARKTSSRPMGPGAEDRRCGPGCGPGRGLGHRARAGPTSGAWCGCRALGLWDLLVEPDGSG